MALTREGEFQERIKTVTDHWKFRNQKIKEWYDVLVMRDNLKQKDLESFISNDPRTSYNLALHLITPPYVPHRIPIDPIQQVEVPKSSEVERVFAVFWRRVDRRNRNRGRKTWLRELNSYILSTGWYAVLALALPAGTRQGQSTDELIAEIWNPYDVYPMWDDEEGLVECVHSYRVSRAALMKKVKAYGWIAPRANDREFSLNDYHYYDDNGDVANCVMVGNEFVRPPSTNSKLSRIPITVSPCGGLPDRGSILGVTEWQKHVGEALVATNEFVIHNYNKQVTYLQQLLRDTAQPVSYERGSQTPIIKDPQELYRRGAHFRLGISGELGYIQKPAIPVDFRSVLFDLQGMLQRGSLPYMLYGNITQQVTGYMMSQVASSAQQILSPYSEASSACLTDVDDHWLEQIRKQKLTPWGLSVPQIPREVEIVADIRIAIPGDAANRATVARMLNPNFQLSETILMDMMFPEITDPIREMARVRSENALRNPVGLTIQLANAYREQAKILRASGEHQDAELFEMASALLMQQIAQQGQQMLQGEGQGQAPTPRQEVAPREAMEGAGGAEPGMMPGM